MTAVTDRPSLRWPRRGLAGFVAMLVLGVIAVGASVVISLYQADRLRAVERAAWEARLATAAREQRDFLQAAGDAGLAALAKIPQSPTVGLFLTEYRAQRGDFDRIMDGVQQLDYIRNYLTLISAEHGYQTGDAPPAVRANLPGVLRLGEAVEQGSPSAVPPADGTDPDDTTSLILREFAFEGIALVNLSGDVIVATDEFPPLTFAIRDYIATAARGMPHVSIAFDAPDGRPTQVSLHPAYAFLDTPGPEAQLAWVIGLRLLEEVFDTSLPAQRRYDQPDIASVAVYRSGEGVRALSRLDEETVGGALVLSPEQAPAWALALETPGAIDVVAGLDGRMVLTASAGFDSVPVSIVTSIPVEEAFAGLDEPISAMRWLLIPVSVLAVAGLALAWLMVRPPRRPAERGEPTEGQ